MKSMLGLNYFRKHWNDNNTITMSRLAPLQYTCTTERNVLDPPRNNITT